MRNDGGCSARYAGDDCDRRSVRHDRRGGRGRGHSTCARQAMAPRPPVGGIPGAVQPLRQVHDGDQASARRPARLRLRLGRVECRPDPCGPGSPQRCSRCDRPVRPGCRCLPGEGGKAGRSAEEPVEPRRVPRSPSRVGSGTDPARQRPMTLVEQRSQTAALQDRWMSRLAETARSSRNVL